MIQPWQQLASRQMADYRIFRVRSDLKRSPRTGREHDFFVMESVDWVNVIPLTTDDRLVMIEQFRHGTNTVELEVPGGVMDLKDASPEATAIRELREETGYEGTGARIIGSVFPNPAIMSNTCYTVMVENCRLLHPLEFDHSEDIVTRLVPLENLSGLVASGQIRHSLVVVALYYFDLLRRG
jgi:8-oxo-dGTP pyrophosphatase MutT (NUDIX family)